MTTNISAISEIVQRIRSVNPFVVLIHIAAFLGIAGSAVLLLGAPSLVIFVSAATFGFCEINGHCGASHIGTLAPLRVLGGGLWLRANAAYTLAGVASAALTGAMLGILGNALRANPEVLPTLIVPLALILAARELGWVRFPLPQIARQTHKMWAMRFGLFTGAAMWGAHIGLALFTVVRHGGIYVLTISALYCGPMQAAALFVVFWLGRTIPIWVVPMLAEKSVLRDGMEVSNLVSAPESEQVLSRLAAMSLILAAGASGLLAFTA